MKHILLFLSFIFISIASFSQEWNRDSIIRGIKNEVDNNPGVKENFSTYCGSIIKQLEKSRKDTLALFPYSPVDSVLYHTFHTFNKQHIHEKKRIIHTRKLNDSIVGKLILLVNNPIYFEWGECGTPIPETEAVFYYKGKEIARIGFACTLGQLSSNPDNILTRWGNLNEQGSEILDTLGLWPQTK